MDSSLEIIALGTKLAEVMARKTVEAISVKIKTVKQNNDQNIIINNLEEIINELISDKNELIQIAQAYEEILITQKMSDKEIDYITTSIIPLVEKFAQLNSEEDDNQVQDVINLIKPILSKETINIMQILGFNFKKALGEPLTELTAALINSKLPISQYNKEKFALLNLEKEVKFIGLCENQEYYDRFKFLCEKN